MNNVEIDYKGIWVTYKQSLLDEFEHVCREVSYIQINLEELRYAPIQNSLLKLRTKQRLDEYKVQGRVFVNILIIIDRIDNMPTVANLSALYESAFEVFGVKEYNHHELPINHFLEETRSCKDKWEELKGILEQSVSNMDKHTMKNEEVWKYASEQLLNMNKIEERFEKDAHDKAR